jgi:hypothetical protein
VTLAERTPPCPVEGAVLRRLELSVAGGPGRRGRVGSRSGQVMIEYAAVAAMLVASVTMFALFLYAFREFSERVLQLVAYEYP